MTKLKATAPKSRRAGSATPTRSSKTVRRTDRPNVTWVEVGRIVSWKEERCGVIVWHSAFGYTDVALIVRRDLRRRPDDPTTRPPSRSSGGFPQPSRTP